MPNEERKDTTLRVRCIDRETYEPIKPLKDLALYDIHKGPEQAFLRRLESKENNYSEATFPVERCTSVAIAQAGVDNAPGIPFAVCCLCPGSTTEIDIFGKPSVAVPEHTELRVHVFECEREGREKRLYAGVATVTAKPVLTRTNDVPGKPHGSDAHPATSNLNDGLATLSLKPGTLYEITLSSNEQTTGCRPRLPLNVAVGHCEFMDIEICIELCSPRLSVLFSDSCGRPLRNLPVTIGDIERHTNDSGLILHDLKDDLVANQQSVSLQTEDFDLNPSQLPINADSLSQVASVQVSRKGLGELFIEVVDSTGKPYADTNVLIQSVSGGNPVRFRTDRRGVIRRNLQKGDYIVQPEPQSAGAELQEPIRVTVS
jgi:hypothetical protein